MADDTPVEWSADEARQLRHERFVAEILRSRGGPAKAAAEAKPWWERLLNATAVTALVGVIGTGLLGQWVAGKVQERTKQREMALASQREYLNAELETVKAAYRLVGSYLSASEDLILITGPEYQAEAYSADAVAALEAQKQAMRKHSNTVDATWRSERDALGYLMAYYHDGNQGVAQAWGGAQQAVDAYGACAAKWHNTRTSATEAEVKGACASERASANARVNTLTQLLGTTRELMWQPKAVGK